MKTYQRQKIQRRKNQENAYIFDALLQQCLGEIEREDWEFAIEMTGGSVSKAAAKIGLNNIPTNAKALWGKTANHARDQYRQWQNRKAKIKRVNKN